MVRFTSVSGFSGDTSFSYTVTDGGSTVSATVTVHVDPPTAANDSAVARPLQEIAIWVTGNDVDANGDPLRVTGVSSASGGTPSLDPGYPGVVRFTSVSGFSGDTSFSYTVTDGGSTVSATVTVHVDPPTAANDSAVARPLQEIAIWVTGNDVDANGDPLRVTGVSGASGGTPSLDPGYPGVVRFTSVSGFSGDTSFSYTVTDGGSTVSATVTVRIDSPSAANDSAVARPLQEIAIWVTGNDVDANGDPLRVTGVGGAGGGTPSLDPSHPGVVRFTSVAGFSGDTSFSYTVTDGGSTVSATVTVTVLSPGPAP